MKKYFTICIFFLAISVSLSAQKVVRASKLLQEGKYDKSSELFTELYEKDNSDIAAAFGMVISKLKLSELIGSTLSYNELIYYFKVSQKAQINFNKLTAADQTFIYANVLKTDYNLLNVLSAKMWTDHLISTKSPATLYEYIYNYHVPSIEPDRRQLNYRLEELYYDSLSAVNSKYAWEHLISMYPNGKYTAIANNAIAKIDFDVAISTPGTAALKAYTVNYPNNNFTRQAYQEIEKREYAAATANPTEINLEYFLNKYPNTEYRNVIQEKLAKLYLVSVKKAETISEIDVFIEKLKGFRQTTYIQNLIDSCRAYSFKIDYRELSDDNDVAVISALLRKYSDLENNQIDTLKSRHFRLWLNKLSNEGLEANPVEVQTFLNQYTGFNSTDVNTYFTKIRDQVAVRFNTSKSALVENALRHELFSEVSEIRLSKIVQLLSPYLKISLNLNTSSIGNILDSYAGSGETLSEVEDLFMNYSVTNDVYLNNLDNSAADIFSMSYTDQNGKKVEQTYVWNESGYIPANLNTSASIYGSIMSRYGIISFTKPTYRETNYNGEYTIRLYGYRVGDQRNYPSYQISMIYKVIGNRFIPDRALSIDSNYSTILDLYPENNFSSISSLLKNFIDYEQNQ